MGRTGPRSSGVRVDDVDSSLMAAPPAARGQEGFAIVLALLALMVLAGIASAAVAAAVGQLRAAAMANGVLASRTGARAGVEVAAETTRGTPASVVGGSAVELASGSHSTRGSWRVWDVRLSEEFHLFVGEGEMGGAVPMREARLVWWIDAEARVAGHRAVVEASNVSLAATAQVLSDSTLATRPGMRRCDHLPLLARAFAGPVVPHSALPPGPPEWGAGMDGPDFRDVRLGWYGASALDELADLDLSGGSPAPPGCPTCWAGLVFGRGSVRLTGDGAGVLAVVGDVSVGPGASWTGLVLVSGNIVLESSARVVGLVRAGGQVAVGDGAAVDGSACAALQALRAATRLARPVPLAGRSWVGPVPPAGADG